MYWLGEKKTARKLYILISFKNKSIIEHFFLFRYLAPHVYAGAQNGCKCVCYYDCTTHLLNSFLLYPTNQSVAPLREPLTQQLTVETYIMQSVVFFVLFCFVCFFPRDLVPPSLQKATSSPSEKGLQTMQTNTLKVYFPHLSHMLIYLDILLHKINV